MGHGARRWRARRAGDRVGAGVSADGPLPRLLVARVAAALFVLCGGVIVASPLLPAPPGLDQAGVVAAGATAVLAGLVAWHLPWARWPRPASLALVPVALAIIAVNNHFGAADPYRYSVFFLVTFTWIGMAHPRGTSLLCVSPLVAAYLLPLATAGRWSPATAGSVVYVALVCVAIAEMVAWVAARLGRTQGALRASEGRLRTVLADAPIVLFTLDAAGRFTLTEGRGLAALGRRPGEAIGHSIFDRYRDTPEFLAQARHALAGVAFTADCTIGSVAFEVRWTPLADAAGGAAGASAVATDVTARRAAEATLRASEARLGVLLRTAGILNAALDRDRVLHELAGHLIGVLGARAVSFTFIDAGARLCNSVVQRAAPGLPTLTDTTTWEPLDDYPLLARAADLGVPQQHYADDPDLDPSERDYLRAFGLAAELLVPILVRGVADCVLEVYWDRAGTIADETVALCAAIAGQAAVALEHARLYADAERRATHDPLTGLPNRALLEDRLGRATATSRRDGRPAALLALDLDGFKDVNDTLGHEAGDDLLRQVAGRLRGALRASDTAARPGGDEFAALLPDTDEAGALAVARALGAALEPAFRVAGRRVHIRASVGVALAPAHGDDPATLLRHADVALYAAKRGHLAHAVYTSEEDAHSPDRLALAGDLRAAIAGGDLTLHYQPKLDLATGRVRGVEALVRWTHPTLGPLPPDQFIPLAERTGLIGALTRWALGAALRQCRAWRDAGLDLTVAVNLSMWDLRDAGLPDTVAALLRAHGVPPACLRLELTESAVMGDAARALEVLARLRTLGARLAVDDFGTGYSSLAYLTRLPVDELKIDRSFVRDLAREGEGAGTATLVASVVGLAHNLGLTVVAEGMEDAETLAVLTRLGCDVAQGYYVSRPLPAPELERWLREAGATRAVA